MYNIYVRMYNIYVSMTGSWYIWDKAKFYFLNGDNFIYIRVLRNPPSNPAVGMVW